jgi:restriction endonuclease, S subunit
MEYKRLKDIAKITMGQSPDSSSYNNEKDGLPFFQGNADFGELYPKERFWCNAPKKVAMPGDILISVRAPIGALNYAKGKSCIGRGLAAITIENIVERNYIFHLLKARNNYLNSMGTGSTFKAIGKNVLEEILIPQISREEQQKCVNMMDLLGSIIRERQSQLGKFDEIIKARFVEDFGNPVTNEKGWRKEYLKDVCYKINDGTHFSPESFETGDYKYVTAKNIKIDGFDFSNITYVSGEVHKLIYERCNPEYGDVLYIKDGVTTGTAMVNTLEEEFTLLSSVALLKQDRNIMNGFFLCNLLNNKEMYLDIRRNMGGAAITRLTITKLNEIQIIVPPIQLQNEFANFVKEVNKSKVEVQRALDEAQLLFDSLMQKYFG